MDIGNKNRIKKPIHSIIMRHTSKWMAACLLALSGAGAAQAQTEYYDITSEYLQNAAFDQHFDYRQGDTGDANDVQFDVADWTLYGAKTSYIVVGVFQYGTSATFDGVAIPSADPAGEGGGALALLPKSSSTGYLSQDVTLLPGDYRVVVTLWNGGPNEALRGQNAWVPKRGSRTQSTLQTAAIGQWTNDTLTFTLKAQTSGRIQVGYTASSKAGVGTAKLLIDRVRILRGHDIDKADVDYQKTFLKPLLDQALSLYGDGAGTGAAEYKATIDEAQALYDNDAAALGDVKGMIARLEVANEDYRWDNGGYLVVTDTRYARGATKAFGRLTTQGFDAADIAEQGFCWNTTGDPTVEDNTTTRYLENNGHIYRLENLQPATLHYMRAYVKHVNGRVKYGDVIKFYTIPKGQITYYMRDGGEGAIKNRITQATEDAVDIWNNLTQLRDVQFSVGYVEGVQTADCSYGGWIRVGPNTSYQATGTLLHEMLHGVGVIPWAGTQWSKNILRESLNGDGYGTGHWLGERVSEVLDFWDNTTGQQLNGDYQHMWPYGINGASEDRHTDLLYYGNGLVCEALAEDGLETSSAHHAVPYYSIDIVPGQRYYIKNESATRGRDTSFFMDAADGRPVIKPMTAAEAEANDSTAWTLTFTPANQLYQLRNVATGRWLTFEGNAFRTVARSEATEADGMQLMKGRVDVTTDRLRGYWIVHPENYNWSPHVLAASSATSTMASTLNLSNASATQRWLILDAGQMRKVNETADGIELVRAGEAVGTSADTTIYDLQGRRVGNALSRGVYIQNGRKFVVK